MQPFKLTQRPDFRPPPFRFDPTLIRWIAGVFLLTTGDPSALSAIVALIGRVLA